MQGARIDLGLLGACSLQLGVLERMGACCTRVSDSAGASVYVADRKGFAVFLSPHSSLSRLWVGRAGGVMVMRRAVVSMAAVKVGVVARADDARHGAHQRVVTPHALLMHWTDGWGDCACRGPDSAVHNWTSRDR